MKSIHPASGHKPNTPSGGRGFVLIVTVSMMILLVLLAVALLSMSTLTTRGSSITDTQQQAEANARLALMTAIGELQNHLGPDQRISMTADQRMPLGGDGSVSSAATGNRYWTGVYNAWSSSELDRPDPASSFRSWLVSGAPDLVSLENAADTMLADSGSVELVGAGTLVTADPDLSVRAPLVEVESSPNKRGRMAWWVGDQGVKMALATAPPVADTTLADVRNNLNSARRNAHELVSLRDGVTKPFVGVSPDDERLPRILSWRQTSFLTPGPGHPGSLFHDVAPHSTGLMTNVRNGGFRKDISMKMEYHTAAPDLTEPGNVLYRVRSNATGNDEAGINFMELWAYYHLYKQLKFGGGLTYTTGGGIPASTPYLETKTSIEGPGGIVDDDWDMFKHPLVINYELLMSLEVKPHTILEDSTGTVSETVDALFVNWDPIITLWNPHDVAIHVRSFRPSQSVGTHPRKNCYLFFYPAFPYDLNLNINGTPITCPLNKVTQSSICMDVGRVEDALRDDPIILKPGEVVMFSQVGSNNHSQSGRVEVDYWGAGFSQLRLFAGAGFNFGGGMAAVARDDTNSTDIYQKRSNTSPISRNAGAVIRMSNGDSLSYSLSPRADRDGGGSGGNSLLNWHYMIGNPWGRHMRGLSIYGMASLDHDWGYSRAQEGEDSSDRTRIPNPFNYRPTDPGVVDLFPTFNDPSTTQQLTYARLAAEKVPFASISLRAKTEMEGVRGTKTLARLNPKAHFTNFWDLSPEERDMFPYELQIRPVTSFLDSGLAEVMPNGRSYFGSSMDGAFGSGFVTTHTVPRQPLVSLASFQHSFANGFNRLAATGLTGYPDHGNGLPERHTRLARHPLLPQISHAIGNSLAPAVLAPDEYEHVPASGARNPHPLADHSYLANRELWDDWFLSGIAPQPAPAFDDVRNQQTVALEFFRDGAPLPVVRYLPDAGHQDPTELANSLFSGGIPTAESINRVASHLRVDGMFNVNSTSVEAWKAILGSLKGRPIVVRNEGGQESIASQDEFPVVNTFAPRDILIEDDAASSPDRNSNWDGRRELSEDEIDTLARTIVVEVRKRGPFLNLGDFINRRVGTDVELARAGAIQSALDSPDTGINDDQNSGRSVAAGVAGRLEFPEAEQGAIHYGAPSLVKQGDILTPIAPVLSARSDSFIIRAYGEALDRSGNITARAWCEAVVQRTRDYVDSADEAHFTPAELTSEANRVFGRQFKMVSFRWLNPSEV